MNAPEPNPRATGTPLRRIEGPAKVTGTAPYAYEQQAEGPAYLFPLTAPVARGRVRGIDASAAEELDGVLVVLTHHNAPALESTGDAELEILQGDEIHFRCQLLGAVLADTPETARHAAELVRIDCEEWPHETELRDDSRELYTPDKVNPAFPATSDEGGEIAEEIDQALYAEHGCAVDVTYTTPMEHNNPMEPHATTALWEEGPEGPRLTLYDSTQGAHTVRTTLAPLLGLDPGRVRVINPHVGGGFGSKGMPHAHNVLAAMAAKRLAGRPVKLALTRQQMFSLVGYRTPTVQRMRLAATKDGRLTALGHDVLEQTARIKEFAEQSAVPSRMMYAAHCRHTAHRLAALDLPVNSWMRAPGEAPGMFALECAMDELAHACGIDPVELRLRNEPETDPESGNPWSSRRLAECLRTGAERFGWYERPAPGTRREGDWLVGLGVAAATYPGLVAPGNVAEVEHLGGGRYAVRIGAADIGTGARTALTQIAADALEVPADAVRAEIGDTALPFATVAGGSSGTASWGTAVVEAARAFRAEHGTDPAPGARAQGEMEGPADKDRYALHSFGAQFAEARVDVHTGEVRAPRMLGVFSAGRIVNPRTARSQLTGGMLMGMSMALFEESVLDHRTGHVMTHDLASYHVPTLADAGDIEAHWLDDEDPHAGPLGAKGIGEIGIVGSPAAIVNAVHDATGVRVRQLPVTPDKLLDARRGALRGMPHGG
ncbi:xanthine dehydrogenase family protein molybdopterin-binding subunit [Streptomyces sp. ODS28]|uniref:xanthine dehydrogenase family protein molybdopterin-binding subunit n=1 Tax=Streptomyces sp. ODS28 TaxID=3136688 RepID=UPI0031F0C1E9